MPKNSFAAKTPTFQAGDRVRCVDPGPTKLVEGREYVVKIAGEQTILVEGVGSYQYSHRFTPVGSAAPSRRS